MTSAATTSPTPTPAPVCPTCGAELHLEHDGDLHSWVCPNEHGLGFTVTEAYERIDEDEIHAIWQEARHASPGTRACPMCGRHMASVAVAPAPGSDATLALDVCLVDELIWFDAVELATIPVETPDPAPTAEENARLASITKQFGDGLTSEWHSRDRAGLRDHLLHRLHTDTDPHG